MICASFPSNASISTYFSLTEQGYWYARAYNNMLSGCELSRLPLAISLEATEELYDKLSSAELICFFNGNLRTNHPALTKLAFWNYVKNRKNLKISKEDIESLTLDNSVLKKKLDSKKYLLEKIQKFWGGNENIHFYCFYSRLDEKSPNSNGAWLANFKYDNELYSAILMCMPSLESEKMTLDDHLSIIAHEFSHAMCDATFGRENFEKITANFKSPNATVAGWYLNEVLAIILGNCIFKEECTHEKVDVRKEEYCAKGFAPALYKLTRDYFDNAKTIDEAFLKEAIRIFDQVHPHGYINPNICMYNLEVIAPNDIEQKKLLSKLFAKTSIASFVFTNFDDLTKKRIKEIQNSNSTVLVIFSEMAQLDPIKNVLPKKIDDTIGVKIVNHNRRTYIFLKIDNKHSLENRINELFSIS